MSPRKLEPKRGEIWYINLDPTVGSEIKKQRPAVVISSDIFKNTDLRIVIPITTFQTKFSGIPQKVKIAANSTNGLKHDSAADVLQVRCVDIKRFVSKVGKLSLSVLEEVVAGVVVAIDYNP